MSGSDVHLPFRMNCDDVSSGIITRSALHYRPLLVYEGEGVSDFYIKMSENNSTVVLHVVSCVLTSS